MTKLLRFPEIYFREGYPPRPKGASQFLFLTRATSAARVQRAFLQFSSEEKSSISAQSPLGASYNIERSALTPTLRTGVGLDTMDITGVYDYIAQQPYRELNRVLRATGFHQPKNFEWDTFWNGIHSELQIKMCKS